MLCFFICFVKMSVVSILGINYVRFTFRVFVFYLFENQFFIIRFLANMVLLNHDYKIVNFLGGI